MRPANLRTRIFLDSGDPKETQAAINLLGFLDGQTTNPSLIAKSPEARGKKFSADEVFSFYHQIVKKVSGLIPQGSVSIEVYADAETKAEAMLMQAREFYKWIPNAHIKFPTTAEGLKAAEIAVKEGMRVNMTLVFSQEQAAAVYAATSGAKKGDVFLSPFVGRLDDGGENGMDLIKNIIRMHHPPLTPPIKGGESASSLPLVGRVREEADDCHVEVLTASVRSLNHFLQAIELGSDIITAPFNVLKEWAEAGLKTEMSNSKYQISNLTLIPYQEIDLNKKWTEYNISHELTDKGIAKFSEDWNNLIG